jgi:hypothetical protein
MPDWCPAWLGPERDVRRRSNRRGSEQRVLVGRLACIERQMALNCLKLAGVYRERESRQEARHHQTLRRHDCARACCRVSLESLLERGGAPKKVPRLWITLHESSPRLSGSGSIAHRVANLPKRIRCRVRYGLRCFASLRENG